MAQQGIVKKRGQHARKRMFPGISGQRPDLHATRVMEAKERQVVWSALTPLEQLATLDRRLGNGVGAKKQRSRLRLKVAQSASRSELVKNEMVVDAVAQQPAKRMKIKAKDRRAADQKKNKK